MDDYKHESIAQAYQSIYERRMNAGGETYLKQYNQRRDAKMDKRKAGDLTVEAADLAYVIGQLIEDGSVTTSHIKEILAQRNVYVEDDREVVYPIDEGDMSQYETQASKDIKAQMAMAAKHNAERRTGKAKVTNPPNSPKRQKDTRTDDEKMRDATGPRPGSRYRGD